METSFLDLDDAALERYARHLVLPEIGPEGQVALGRARVLIVGAGGLGAPLLQYLAAAGVGHIGLLDDDSVDRSNLQRQVVFREADIGKAKVEAAAEYARALNPDIAVETQRTRLTPENAVALFSGYDVIADGSDNFATRYLVNDAAFLAGTVLVSGAVMRFDGQLSTFRGPKDPAAPCYRCLFGDQPPETRDSCADVGVIGALPGVIGALQAMEVVKEILGIGDSLAGRLLLYDALAARFSVLRAPKDPACLLCGEAPRIATIEPERYRPDSCGA